VWNCDRYPFWQLDGLFCSAIALILVFYQLPQAAITRDRIRSMLVGFIGMGISRLGRVLAADYLIGLVIESTTGLTAGVLADRVFEPVMQAKTPLSSLLDPILGSGTGSGITLLYILVAICTVLVGMLSFMVPSLRSAEALLPNHENIGEQ
jgi:hypothetical protein